MDFEAMIKRKTDNLKALLVYPSILSKLKRKRELFFFFPFWQIGGGEKVHADILEVFSKDNPICFLTDFSKDDGFKSRFVTSSEVVALGRWAFKRTFKKIMLKKIAAAINRQERPVVFGCHSPFFYELIPLLSPKAKVIDLTHAFTFHPNGPEMYSLPYVPRIDKRVILGEKTKKDYIDLYRKHGIDPVHLDKLVIIPNKVDWPSFSYAKPFGGDLIVLFVSRNAEEKRPELFVEIAGLCYEKNLPAKFFMIGDFQQFDKGIPPNLYLVGEVMDRDKLDKLYSQADILLITSWREGFPLVIMEGMVRGVVPISTDVGEIPYYISQEKFKNGFLVDNHLDTGKIVQEFFQKIEHLCHNREELSDFGNSAHNFAKAHFRPEQFRTAYRKLFFGEDAVL